MVDNGYCLPLGSMVSANIKIINKLIYTIPTECAEGYMLQEGIENSCV